MGQLSILELAIIISFGSAVGGPMVGEELPITHGLLAITVVAVFQVTLERFINRHRKVAAVIEGSPTWLSVKGLFFGHV